MNTAVALNSVRARFNAAADSYDRQGGVQPHVARRVADLAACATARRILDVGCGTGRLTRLLTSRFPAAEVVALDLAPAMIEQARCQLGSVAEDIEWVVADVAQYRPPRSFDLVASSSALQWLRPLRYGMAHIGTLLAPRGVLVTGVMLRGTLGELHGLRAELYPHKPAAVQLPTRDALLASVESAGLRVNAEWVEDVVVEYPSAAVFLRILNAQGVTGGPVGNRSVLQRGELRRLTEEYQRRFTAAGGVSATYSVLYLHAEKS